MANPHGTFTTSIQFNQNLKKHSSPSTPVARLMTDFYQEEWIRGQEKKRVENETLEIEKLKQQSQRALKSKNAMLKAHSHNSKQQKNAKAGIQGGNRFILSKFKNIDPKTSSFRASDDLAINKYKVTPLDALD